MINIHLSLNNLNSLISLISLNSLNNLSNLNTPSKAKIQNRIEFISSKVKIWTASRPEWRSQNNVTWKNRSHTKKFWVIIKQNLKKKTNLSLVSCHRLFSLAHLKWSQREMTMVDLTKQCIDVAQRLMAVIVRCWQEISWCQTAMCSSFSLTPPPLIHLCLYVALLSAAYSRTFLTRLVYSLFFFLCSKLAHYYSSSLLLPLLEFMLSLQYLKTFAFAFNK